MAENLDRELFTSLREFIAQVVLESARIAAAAGLTLSEQQVIHLLQLRGPMSPSELGQATRLARPTMTGILDRLVAQGFVSRSPHPTDRRRTVITLVTQRVDQVFGPRYEGHENTVESSMAELSASEKQTVVRFLRQMLDA